MVNSSKADLSLTTSSRPKKKSTKASRIYEEFMGRLTEDGNMDPEFKGKLFRAHRYAERKLARFMVVLQKMQEQGADTRALVASMDKIKTLRDDLALYSSSIMNSYEFVKPEHQTNFHIFKHPIRKIKHSFFMQEHKQDFYEKLAACDRGIKELKRVTKWEIEANPLVKEVKKREIKKVLERGVEKVGTTYKHYDPKNMDSKEHVETIISPRTLPALKKKEFVKAERSSGFKR